MSPIQIALPFNEAPSPWARFGLEMNPFPESGVPSSVDYDEYQQPEIRQVNQWLGAMVSPTATQFGPLLLKGSIGVGKTHVLRRIERVLSDFGRKKQPGAFSVSYHTLTGTGAKTLLLSNLLLEGLRTAPPGLPEAGSAAEFPLLGAIFAKLRKGPKDPQAFLDAFPQTSPVRAPFRKVLAESDLDRRRVLEGAFSAWLARREVSRADLDRLSVGGRLEGEGEAVRAVAHVVKVARHLLQFRAWVILLDQLEDLWNPQEVTALRRARFLTDLRTLIDEGLEGAPVAVVLAWNTEIARAGSKQGEIDVRLREEYLALYSRLPAPIDLPMLPAAHALPFAERYVVQAPGQGDPAEVNGRASFIKLIRDEFDEILASVPAWGRTESGRLVQRALLGALRTWGDKVATRDRATKKARAR